MKHSTVQRPSGEMPTAIENGGRPRSLAVLGDSGDIHAWSNIPYFLFRAAKEAGFLTHTLKLLDPHYRRRQILWNAGRLLQLHKPGGYQWSRQSLRRMWDCVPPELRQGEFISHMQLFPPIDMASRAGAQFSPYIDSALGQQFTATYLDQEKPRLSLREIANIIGREGEAYRAAKFFIGMARATVDWAVRECGVDPSRAFTVRPGANLDEEMVKTYLARRGASWRSKGEPFTARHPARLGFIGRFYIRKGLPRLVEAAEILHSRGRPVVVSVIGHCPDHLRGHPQVECVGMIDKATDMARFIDVVDRFALGCLPSWYEPLGISTLEALRMGVPVMGTQTGGIPDCIPPHAGFLLPVDVTGEGIADAIEQHLFNPDRYHQLQQGALDEMSNVTWERTVEKLIEIWKGDQAAS